jgi:hypothetical protein
MIVRGTCDFLRVRKEEIVKVSEWVFTIIRTLQWVHWGDLPFSVVVITLGLFSC